MTNFPLPALPLDSSPPSQDDAISLQNLLNCIENEEEVENKDERKDEEKAEEMLEEKQIDYPAIIAAFEKILVSQIGIFLRTKFPSQSFNDSEHAKVYPFGSYALGVWGPETDVDLVLLTSKLFTRHEFFTVMMQAIVDNGGNCQSLHDAYVPLLKIEFMGVDIDLLFAQVNEEDLTNANIYDDEFFETVVSDNTREKDCISLNGVRVTKYILETMKDKEQFVTALTVIKKWARTRGIYSSVMGYLGGVSWAILVTKICQLFPNANAAMTIRKFFFFYSRWKFGVDRPISIRTDDTKRIYTPESSRDGERPLMFIMTPVIPYINTSFNVTKATFRLVLEEFQRADKILNDQPETVISEEIWIEVLAPSRFFYNHSNYLLIRMGAPNVNFEFLIVCAP